MNKLWRNFRRILLSLSVGMLFCSQGLFAQAIPDLSEISLPPGFSIEIWTDKVPNARSMALADDGTVFVATRSEGAIYAVVPSNDGLPKVIKLANDLNMPNGIAVHHGDLYVAENHRITRFANIIENLEKLPKPEIIIDTLPTEAHHGWRYIDFGPDGKLYIAIGAPCNVCDREGFATISRMNPDGTDQEVVAYGIRNSVGFTWDPETGDLWFTDNGRDMLGDDIPAGELNHAPRIGMHFGFPYCHGGDVADPEFGKARSCDEFEPPAQKLGPHVAPLGVTFYTGEMFPPEYAGQVLIAEHGSWNRSKKNGYRISMVRMIDGKASGYEVFADGWLQDEVVSGRPVDLLVISDGSLLVSDDRNGIIYRITYTRPINEAQL